MGALPPAGIDEDNLEGYCLDIANGVIIVDWTRFERFSKGIERRWRHLWILCSYPPVTAKSQGAKRRSGNLLANANRLLRQVKEEAESRVRLIQRRDEMGKPRDLPPITQKDIANRAGCRPYDFTRVKQTAMGQELAWYFSILTDPDALLRWWADHRRYPGGCS
jgi:hypothetical protein